jgi:cyclic pyranopterin monophosphate synthase
MTAAGSVDGPSPAGALSHVDEHGRAHMVDVTGKPMTRRVAEARCLVRTSADPAAAIGADLVEEARISGIMAAKQTSALLPLCHPIPIDGMTVDIVCEPGGLRVSAVAEVTERTGVEMEALTGCAVAALVLLQTLLTLDRDSSIEELTLWSKSGGRSGNWQRSEDGRMGWEGQSSGFR